MKNGESRSWAVNYIFENVGQCIDTWQQLNLEVLRVQCGVIAEEVARWYRIAYSALIVVVMERRQKQSTVVTFVCSLNNYIWAVWNLVVCVTVFFWMVLARSSPFWGQSSLSNLDLESIGVVRVTSKKSFSSEEGRGWLGTWGSLC